MNDDVPEIRLWGDSRLARGQHVALPDTATPPTMPAGSDLASLERVVEPARTSEHTEAAHRLRLVLLTSDGAPIEAALRVLPHGAVARDASTTPAGDLDLESPEGAHDVELADECVELPPVPERPVAVRADVRIARRKGRCTLSTVPEGAAPKRVVIERPSCHEVVLDGWAQGSKVLRWGGASERVDPSDGRPKVGTARAFLRRALWMGRGRCLLAAGHTDASGSEGVNDVVALERARSVYLYASGDLDGFAEHAAANADDLDLDCALVAASRILGSPTSLDDADGLAASLDLLAAHAGHPLETPPQRWRAIADCYEIDLAAILGTDLAGLAMIRAEVRWIGCGYASLGERWPRSAGELVLAGRTPDPRAQRRVGLLIMSPSDGHPSLAEGDAIDEVYDGTFRRSLEETPAEALVVIRLLDADRNLMPGGRAWIHVGDLGVHEHRSLSGIVTFSTLDGDQIRVIAAVDERGGSTLTDGGTT